LKRRKLSGDDGAVKKSKLLKDKGKGKKARGGNKMTGETEAVAEGSERGS